LGTPTDDEFGVFYAAHRTEVFRTAYLIAADREEAHDLTQETFVRAIERWSEVSRHERPAAWLQTVVARLAISWRRRQAVRSRRTPRPATTTVDDASAYEPAVLAALRSLTPTQRSVLVLRYLADRSVDEVAHTLGKRPGTVKALTAQALERLRPLLEARGVLR
jgi:RNA polymerase sigma-70 factor (sigma-E family)